MLAEKRNADETAEGSERPQPALNSRNNLWQLCLTFAAFTGLACFFLSLNAYNLVDPDLWHELALIRESLRVGHLLRHDVFSYTSTVDPSIHHEWGAGLIAYALSHWFGGNSLLILKYLIAFLVGALSLRCARSMGASVQVWVVLCPIAILLSRYGFLSVIRAQAYTFLFAAGCFWLFQKDRRGNRSWMIAWLCVFPLWVNVHGGFVVGIGLLALYAIERALGRQPYRHLVLLLVGTSLEIFLNPFGTAYFGYIVRALTMTRPHVYEWRPVWAYGPGWTATFLLALAIAAYAIAKHGVRHSPGALMVLATACEAALHCKLMPLFAIAWISHVPAYLEPTPVSGWVARFHQRRAGFVLALWLVVASVYFADSVRWQFWQIRVPQSEAPYPYPVGAVGYLGGQGFAGNVMVPFSQGAYVSWKLFPAVKVSVDSRYEVAYSDALVDSTFRFYAAEPGWDETLRRYPTDLVLVPTSSALAKVIPKSGWREVYVDREFELYARPGLTLPFSDRTAEFFTGVFP